MPSSGVPVFRTRGQPVAVATLRAMLTGSVPHAILLVGPPAVGKTTLARDLAAGLLCTDPDRVRRPCRECRACRLADAGTHPDLHRLRPEGPGRQIRIGDPPEPEPGTVRWLVGALALTSVEGGARVAVVEEAVRMNEEAQHALLKTLEEPPPGVTIVLCVDDEGLLLPTVRSRCARIRLGPVGVREIEALLAELELADAPTAARLARLSGGRPGVAIALARAPESSIERAAIVRGLLDALDAPRPERLALVRELTGRAATIAGVLDPGSDATTEAPGSARGKGRATKASAEPAAETVEEGEESSAPTKASASDRRRAAGVLLGIWREVARDLVVLGRGGRRQLRDPGLLEELEAVVGRLPAPGPVDFLARLDRTALAIERNANPELALDVLTLAWSGAPETERRAS